MNIKKLILEAAQEIEQEIADGTLKIGEAKSFKVNPKYTHFAVDKATGKIITGWEYKDLDPQSIATYVKQDLKDLDWKPSDVEIKTVKSLKSKNIDPFNWSSWNDANNPTNEESEYDSSKMKNTVIRIILKFNFPSKLDGISREKYVGQLISSWESSKSKDTIIKFLANKEPKTGVYFDKAIAQKLATKIEEVLKSTDVKEATLVISTPTGDAPTDPLKKKQAMDATKKGDTVKYVKPGLAEAAGGDLLLYLAQLLAATSLSTWAGFSWAKGLLAIPDFKKDLEAAKSKEDKIEVIKGALSHVVNPTDTGSYKDSLKEAADEPTDAEQEEPAEESGNISDKLSELISQAIDAAGQVISSTEDKKLETALGKVLKNLTASQDALAKVSEHEGKLAEKVEAETAKNQDKYNKEFSKGLKRLKVPADLEPKIQKLFKLALPAGMKKGVAPDKLAEKLWSHFTLNESKK